MAAVLKSIHAFGMNITPQAAKWYSLGAVIATGCISYAITTANVKDGACARLLLCPCSTLACKHKHGTQWPAHSRVSPDLTPALPPHADAVDRK